MPDWIGIVILAAVIAFITAISASRALRRKDVDSGAGQQREADDEGEANAVRRAGTIKDTLRRAPDADLDRRIDDSL